MYFNPNLEIQLEIDALDFVTIAILLQVGQNSIL